MNRHEPGLKRSQVAFGINMPSKLTGLIPIGIGPVFVCWSIRKTVLRLEFITGFGAIDKGSRHSHDTTHHRVTPFIAAFQEVATLREETKS